MKKTQFAPLILFALIKMSSIGITALSGKAGGTIYSRNKGGTYAKNLVMPSNTFSFARQFIRGLFGAISAKWRTLTTFERNTWITQAPNYPYVNRLGDSKTLSGNALFVRSNMNLVNAGFDMIDVQFAPQGTNAPSVVNAPLKIVDSDSDMFFDLILATDNATQGNGYVIEATPPVSDSVRNVENQFRRIAPEPGEGAIVPTGTTFDQNDVSSPDALYAKYEKVFGRPDIGETVWFRIKAVNPLTGEVSVPFVLNAVVQADF